MKPVLLVLAVSLALQGIAHAGAKKQSAVAVRFYTEAGSEGGNFSRKVELLNPKRTTYMGELPLISEQDIKACYPFEAPDGSGTFGTYFRLNDHGANLLAQHTMSRRGSYVLVFFNGRHVVDLYVDRPVQDGIAVIPSGLTVADVELLKETFPIIGREDIKPSRKKAAPKKTKAPKAAGSPSE